MCLFLVFRLYDLVCIYLLFCVAVCVALLFCFLLVVIVVVFGLFGAFVAVGYVCGFLFVSCLGFVSFLCCCG